MDVTVTKKANHSKLSLGVMELKSVHRVATILYFGLVIIYKGPFLLHYAQIEWHLVFTLSHLW